MSIYNKTGAEISDAYDINGTSLDSAYDINGTEVFSGLDYDLRIMSINVQWFLNINADAYHLVRNTITEHDPDFIGFQEWEENYGIGTIDGYAPDVYLDNIGYDVIVGNGTTISNKNALASKIQMSNASEVGYTRGYKMGYNKAYITYDNKQIAVYSTHLYYNIPDTAIRIAECQQLLADAENEDYVIIAGDFNTYAETVSDSEYADAIGLFQNAGYNVANGDVIPLSLTYFNGVTVESSTGKWPNDNIITSGNIDIVKVVIDDTKLSAGINKNIDHLPLIAYVKIN